MQKQDNNQYSIKLSSGDIYLSVNDVDLFAQSEEDQTFLNELIALFASYDDGEE